MSPIWFWLRSRFYSPWYGLDHKSHRIIELLVSIVDIRFERWSFLLKLLLLFFLVNLNIFYYLLHGWLEVNWFYQSIRGKFSLHCLHACLHGFVPVLLLQIWFGHGGARAVAAPLRYRLWMWVPYYYLDIWGLISIYSWNYVCVLYVHSLVNCTHRWFLYVIISRFLPLHCSVHHFTVIGLLGLTQTIVSVFIFFWGLWIWRVSFFYFIFN